LQEERSVAIHPFLINTSVLAGIDDFRRGLRYQSSSTLRSPRGLVAFLEVLVLGHEQQRLGIGILGGMPSDRLAARTHRSIPSSLLVVEMVGTERRNLPWQRGHALCEHSS